MEAQNLACAEKKARRDGRLIVFIDESGLRERPTRVQAGGECLDSIDGCPDGVPAAFLAGPEPVEYRWAWLKRDALANFCPAHLDELNVTARNQLKSAQHRPSIVAACGVQAGL